MLSEAIVVPRTPPTVEHGAQWPAAEVNGAIPDFTATLPLSQVGLVVEPLYGFFQVAVSRIMLYPVFVVLRERDAFVLDGIFLTLQPSWSAALQHGSGLVEDGENGDSTLAVMPALSAPRDEVPA